MLYGAYLSIASKLYCSFNAMLSMVTPLTLVAHGGISGILTDAALARPLGSGGKQRVRQLLGNVGKFFRSRRIPA